MARHPPAVSLRVGAHEPTRRGENATKYRLIPTTSPAMPSQSASSASPPTPCASPFHRPTQPGWAGIAARQHLYRPTKSSPVKPAVARFSRLTSVRIQTACSPRQTPTPATAPLALSRSSNPPTHRPKLPAHRFPSCLANGHPPQISLQYIQPTAVSKSLTHSGKRRSMYSVRVGVRGCCHCGKRPRRLFGPGSPSGALAQAQSFSSTLVAVHLPDPVSSTSSQSP